MSISPIHVNVAQPVRMDMVVVFPAPLCPSRAVICPLYMFRLRSSTATLRCSCRCLLEPLKNRDRKDCRMESMQHSVTTMCNLSEAAPPVRLVQLRPDHFSSRPDYKLSRAHVLTHNLRSSARSYRQSCQWHLFLILVLSLPLNLHTSQGLFFPKTAI